MTVKPTLCPKWRLDGRILGGRCFDAVLVVRNPEITSRINRPDRRYLDAAALEEVDEITGLGACAKVRRVT